MYIKKTLKTDFKSQKIYTAFHLVESVRTERGPRQRVLLYMGSEINLPEEQHKILAQCIENLVQGTPLLFYPEEVTKLAQVYASQIVRRLSSPESSKQESQPEFVSIDVHSIEQSEPRSVGCEHLMLQMAKQLRLPEQLEKLGFSTTDAAIAIGSIIARAVHPKSERETYRWLCASSGLGELLDYNFKKTSLDKLYQISDKLLTHKNTLEGALETIEQKFHGYRSTIALYDLTNTYMEGQAKTNPKAMHGVSKEKRSDCPLITMGLVMNEHGFLSRTSFLPGNASESKTLQFMIESLNTHQSLFKPTIILDAGIATKENLAWLRDNGYRYVVSARQDAPSIEFEGQLVPVDDRHNLVKAAIINHDGNEEKWLYCESEAKAKVASSMKRKFRQRFEDDLKKLSAGLSKPRGRKKHAKILERIGRLKEKHKRISGCYEVNAIPSEDGLTAVSVEWKIIEEKMDEKLTGSYFLRTNRIDSDVKELWQLYNVLRRVEDAFRFMKSHLGLRPVYHHKEHRVDGHLWITILAYHLIQHCTYQLGQHEINYQWETARNIMKTRVRVTTQAKMAEGKILYHRSTTKAEGEQLEIYKALGLSSSILKSQKTIV
jgi:transposase